MAEIKKSKNIFDNQVFLSQSFVNKDMYRSIFRNCDLNDSCFKKTILSGSVFIDCCLKNVKFENSDLNSVTFLNCDLAFSDFRGSAADIHDLNIVNCDATGVLGIDNFPMRCPETGGFTAWKKGFAPHAGYTLIKLYIPANAKRSSAGGTKCRCNMAKVLSITHVNDDSMNFESCTSLYNPEFKYETGKYVTVEDFDEKRWTECSTGIHFFVNKQEAIEYY